ncbi:hypothetical protein [Methanorbis rubei]|uniref:Uncharacterized protein n=1 Tax=Methanorbis rubei TaxID=3028300 RepID=A0AAE4MFT5_9EURY|nr:hypothetical protein [Methanocorpusculaceae archaeon Cs1]
MKYPLLMAVVLLACLIFSAGCVTGGDQNETLPTMTPVPVVLESVTIFPETPGVTYTLTAKPSVEEQGNVEMHLKAVAARDLRKDGYNIRYTFFVYNTGSVEQGWSPQSYEDVVSAGIPYSTKIDRIYPSNERVLDVMLPRAASVKTFDVTKPYVYGVVAVDVTV